MSKILPSVALKAKTKDKPKCHVWPQEKIIDNGGKYVKVYQQQGPKSRRPPFGLMLFRYNYGISIVRFQEPPDYRPDEKGTTWHPRITRNARRKGCVFHYDRIDIPYRMVFQVIQGLFQLFKECFSFKRGAPPLDLETVDIVKDIDKVVGEQKGIQQVEVLRDEEKAKDHAVDRFFERGEW